MKDKRDFRERAFLVVSALGARAILVLKAAGILEPQEADSNTPSWIFLIAGIGFFLAGFSVALGDAGRWSALVASVIVLILGAMFGWVSLYADDSGSGGSVMLLTSFTGIPFHRIIFGVGAVACGMVSCFAFRSFLRSNT